MSAELMKSKFVRRLSSVVCRPSVCGAICCKSFEARFEIFIPQFQIFEARLQIFNPRLKFSSRPLNLLPTSEYGTRAWNIGTPGRIPESALEIFKAGFEFIGTSSWFLHAWKLQLFTKINILPGILCVYILELSVSIWRVVTQTYYS